MSGSEGGRGKETSFAKPSGSTDDETMVEKVRQRCLIGLWGAPGSQQLLSMLFMPSVLTAGSTALATYVFAFGGCMLNQGWNVNASQCGSTKSS